MIQNQEALENKDLQMAQMIEQFPDLEFSFIFSIAFCHLCKRKSLVYSCYKNMKAQSCSKKYCSECMLLEYQTDMHQVLSTKKDWSCPYKLNACICQKCNYSKEPYLKTQVESSQKQIRFRQTCEESIDHFSSVNVTFSF